MINIVSAAKRRTTEIRQRIQAIRSDLTSSLEEAREDGNNLTDRKYYVRSYPHLILPLVAAAAFNTVPHVRKPATSQVAILDGDQGVR